MTFQAIPIGIIGLGAIGQAMLQQFAAELTTRVVAVCDLAADLASSTAAAQGGAHWCTDYRELLDMDDIDLVYVAVPPRQHYQVVLDALAAGKHVLCEKPLALTLAEAHEMLAEARAAGVVHALNLPLYYAPGVCAFGDYVAAGKLGELRRIEVRLVFPDWPRSWQRNAWVGSRVEGGPFREVGPHLVEVIMRCFGPIRRVWAHMDYPQERAACERGAYGCFELADGTLADVNLMCGVAQPETIQLMAYGSRGTLGFDRRLVPLAGDSQGLLSPLPVEPRVRTALIPNLVQAIRGEAADLCGFEIGVAIQAVLEAWEQAAARGQGWIGVWSTGQDAG